MLQYMGEIKMDKYEELLEDGKLFLKNGNYGKAQEIFDQIIEEYPNEVKGYEGAIRAYSFDFKEGNQASYDKVTELLSEMSELVERMELYEYSEFIQKVSVYAAGMLDFDRAELLEQQMQECDRMIERSKKILLGAIVVCVFIWICKMRYVFTGGTSNLIMMGSLFLAAMVALNILMQQLKRNTYERQIYDQSDDKQ